MTAVVEEILAGETRATGIADLMLRNAEWAGAAFARFDRVRVGKIAQAAAEVAFAHAGALAEAAVAETGCGVVADKKVKNERASRALVAFHAAADFCSARVDAQKKRIDLPRPAGILFAPVTATSPVSGVYGKVLTALLTRNAILLAPHPLARHCSMRAVDLMAAAAENAGAPAGIIQAIDLPSPALIEHVRGVSHVLTIGDKPMEMAAYSPGNAPVLVDESADLTLAARCIVASKSFDNSSLPTSESVLLAVETIAERLLQALQSAGAYVARPEEIGALRHLLFDGGTFNAEMLGKSAVEIGRRAGLMLPPETRLILAEIDRIGIDEPLSQGKPCPVLAFRRVPQTEAGITQARALIRLAGTGHSAAIHSRHAPTLLAYGAAVKVSRVVVNAPSCGSVVGQEAPLSSLGEDLEPQHLITWTRMAYGDDLAAAFGDSGDLDAWSGGAAPALGREAPISLGRLQEGAEAVPQGTGRR